MFGAAACVIDGSVTIPAAAKPTVHLLNFIGSSSFIVCLSTIYAFFWGKNGLPRHHPGAFARIDMESRGIWQQLFLVFY
jgi:hypothetical protein